MIFLKISRTLIFSFIVVVSLWSNHPMSVVATTPLEPVTAFPRQAASQGPVEMIAYDFCGFDYNGDYICNVNLMAVDGSKSAFIANAFDPVWSPDGSRIAFAQYGQPGLFVLNLNNWSLTSVHSGGESPAWSPDGTKLSFSAGELFLMSADGSHVVQLTNNVGFRGQPAWSSDGQTIAFDCEVESGNRDICSINTAGLGFMRLTSDPAWDSEATFSPDGSAIAFVTTRYGFLQIAIMNLDGTGISPVGAGIYGFQPTWSPDSTRIAFIQPYSGSCFEADLRNCPDTVFIMNRDGGERQSIGSGNRPTWATSVNPVAWFAPQACNGLDCAFNGSGSWGGNRTIESYTWDFGDGMSGSGATVSHAYSAPGTYRVTLTVTDDAGATGSRSQDINIDGNFWPTARFTYACTGSRCTFDGSGSSDPDGTIASYFWIFGDGGSALGPTVSHTYNAAGPFTATLFVTDNAGGGDNQQEVINLLANELPRASFKVVCTALICTFDGSTSSDADGVIENYAWNFGDGTGASGVTANHTYSWGSTFAVSLTVTDNLGATSVQQSHVTVSHPMHIGDLDGVRTNQKSSWTALVTVTVHNADHSPVTNATVTGSWSIGGTVSCTTDGSGQCILSRSTIPKKTPSVMFTISTVTKSTYLYRSVDNHDPDGNSNGTNITVRSQ